MAKLIEHTPYEWYRRGRGVVLLRRYSLKVVWGFCIFWAGYFALASLLITIALLTDEPAEHVRITPLGSGVVFVISGGFFCAFWKAYKTDKGMLIRNRSWRVGSGIKLACEVMRIPQPTTMGGTLPGPPTKWLVIVDSNGARRRLHKVFHDLDLFEINNALSIDRD